MKGTTGRDTFVMMPHKLTMDSRISHPAARLWCVLRVLEWHGDIPETSRLQVVMDATERSIQRWLRELEDAGWLTWNRKADISRRYKAKSQSEANLEHAALSQIRQMLDNKSASIEEIRAILDTFRAPNLTPESEDLTPESEDLTPESEDPTVGSDPTIRSYDQILLSPNLTPESEDPTPESEDPTPESEDPTPESDHRKFGRIRKPKNRAPRLLDSKTHETHETPTTGQGRRRSDDPRVAYLISIGIHPNKAAEILATWPKVQLEILRGAAEDMQERGAGPGAIASAFTAAPPAPRSRAAGQQDDNPWRATPERRAELRKMLGYDPYGEERESYNGLRNSDTRPGQ